MCATPFTAHDQVIPNPWTLLQPSLNLYDPVMHAETQAYVHLIKACEAICPKRQEPSSSCEFPLPFCHLFYTYCCYYLVNNSSEQPSMCCMFIPALMTDETQHQVIIPLMQMPDILYKIIHMNYGHES